MPWVFDASLAASWCFDDEQTAETEALTDRAVSDPATVPNLFHLEIANILAQAMRRKQPRTTLQLRTQFLEFLSKLPITVDDATVTQAWTTTLSLADRFGLSTYDAAYLELAMRLKIQLGTLDGDLRKAAKSVGVTVVP